MGNKYKLEIPDHYQAIIKHSIYAMNGKIFSSVGLGVYERDGERFAIPPVFMKEIKQSAILIAEEYIDNHIYVDEENNIIFTKNEFIAEFNSLIEKSQLKLWHEGGVGELVDLCVEGLQGPLGFDEHRMMALESILEKIQKPE